LTLSAFFFLNPCLLSVEAKPYIGHLLHVCALVFTQYILSWWRLDNGSGVGGNCDPCGEACGCVWFDFVLFSSHPLFCLGGAGYISKGLLKVSCTCDVFQAHSHSLDVVEQVLDVVFAWAYFEMQSVLLSGEGGAY
jgi:hypothetical protein